LSGRFFSHRRDSQVSSSAAADGETLDPQQAALLEILRRAAGAPVSYGELHERGIEFPAGVVSELELIGVPIERRRIGAVAGETSMGVRLDGSDGQDPPLAASGRDSAAPRALSGAADPRLALAALLIAAVAVLALLGLATGGAHTPHTAAHPHPAKAIGPLSETAHADLQRPAPATGRRPPPTPVSPALATQLDARGHDLLEAGRYGPAVETLERAISATGERLEDCTEPTSETCLTYAYALYDLGRALQLSGHPQQAVAVLQRRLQIDNQRSAVESELAVVRAGA